MLPDPLHPAIVHFPIALAVLLPIGAVAALIAMARRPATGQLPWLAVTGLAVGLAGSTWLALETGEQQEARVESVVSEQPLEIHEDRASTFFAGTLIVLGLAAVGLSRGWAGRLARGGAAVASLALIPLGIRVGGSGGDLVYQHGAAAAYQVGAETRAEAGRPARDRGGDRRDDDE